VRDPRAIAESERLIKKEYQLGELKALRVRDRDILEWLHKALLAGEPSVNGHPEGASISFDQLTLRQPEWIQEAAQNFLETLTWYIKATQAAPGDGTFEVVWSLVPLDARRRVAGRRLARRVSLIVDNLSLGDALLAVRDEGLIAIQVTEKIAGLPAVQNLRISRKFENEPVSSVLNALLAPQALDWYLLDPNVIVVTTRAEVLGRMGPRVYRTKELLTSGQTEKGLAARLTAIEPDSWGALGGPGQLRFLPGVLIVNHNRHVHDQIERLLATLTPGTP
jgi:hypothetical protein